MLNLIKKLAVSDGSNVVLLDNVMSGVDGSSTFGYSLTPTALQVNDGQRQQYKFTHQLDVRTLDPSDADRVKLAVMERDSATVEVAGLAENGFLALRGKLTRSDQFDQVIADRFFLTADAPSGFNAFQYSGDNRLADIDLLNPDGFTGSVNQITCSVSGNEVTYTRVSGNSYIDITRGYSDENLLNSFITYLYPFEGESIVLSVNIVALTAATSATIRISYQDAAGSSLGQTSTTTSSTGVVSVTGVMPAGAVTFRCAMTFGSTAADSVTIKEPILSRGTTVFTL